MYTRVRDKPFKRFVCGLRSLTMTMTMMGKGKPRGTRLPLCASIKFPSKG